MPSLCVCQIGRTCHLLLFSVVGRLGIYKLAPIKIAPVKCHNNDLGSSNIGCNGHIISIARQEELFLNFVVLREAVAGAGVAEINENIYLVVLNSGRNLLFSTLSSAEKLLNFKPCCFGYILGGDTGSADIVLTEYAAIGYAKLGYELFFYVVSNYCYFQIYSPLRWFTGLYSEENIIPSL